MVRPSEAFTIRKVGVFPKTFSPEKEESITIRWMQSQKGKTTVEIHTENGERVRHLESIYPAGEHTVVWDGRDDTERIVPAGVYLYVIQSQDDQGRQATYDPSFTTGGEELMVERFTFDKQKREFQFILPRAARTRLRIGLSPFLHLRTLLDWEPLEGGTHTLGWDGLDSSGWVRAIDHPDLSMNLAAFALPDNAVILKGKEEFSSHMREGAKQSSRSGLYLHALHDRANCRDISCRVEFPGLEKDERGLPILQGKTLVRVQLEDKDRNFMVNQRFEVGFSVDTVFLFEEEDGQDPFNFEWNTTGLSPGEHLLTVNLIGYDDHLGVKTVRVMKK